MAYNLNIYTKINIYIKICFLIFTIIISISSISCDDKAEIDENILATYKEILIIRESEKNTELANSKIQEILKKHNLTENEFRNYLMENMKENKKFISMIDSLRNSFKSELDSLK